MVSDLANQTARQAVSQITVSQKAGQSVGFFFFLLFISTVNDIMIILQNRMKRPAYGASLHELFKDERNSFRHSDRTDFFTDGAVSVELKGNNIVGKPVGGKQITVQQDEIAGMAAAA